MNAVEAKEKAKNNSIVEKYLSAIYSTIEEVCDYGDTLLFFSLSKTLTDKQVEGIIYDLEANGFKVTFIPDYELKNKHGINCPNNELKIEW